MRINRRTVWVNESEITDNSVTVREAQTTESVKITIETFDKPLSHVDINKEIGKLTVVPNDVSKQLRYVVRVRDNDKKYGFLITEQELVKTTKKNKVAKETKVAEEATV